MTAVLGVQDERTAQYVSGVGRDLCSSVVALILILGLPVVVSRRVVSST